MYFLHTSAKARNMGQTIPPKKHCKEMYNFPKCRHKVCVGVHITAIVIGNHKEYNTFYSVEDTARSFVCLFPLLKVPLSAHFQGLYVYVAPLL